MSDAPHPELRASDEDRERTADMLRRAAGEGRLTMDELDDRLNAAYGSRTRSELAVLVADVVVPGDQEAAEQRRSARLPVRPGEGGARWLVAIMGGCERKGRWRLREQLTSLNVMGGADFDLNEAELSAPRTEMTIFSLMGGAEVRVPEGLNLEVTDFAFMGGNDVDVRDAEPDPGGPVLHLRLISIMGGTTVRRGRKLTRAERRAERSLHRWHG
jgi:Domain of unknown function (DUF1707)